MQGPAKRQKCEEPAAKPSALDFGLEQQDAYDMLPPNEKGYAAVKADVERRYFGLCCDGCPFRFVLLDERGGFQIEPCAHAGAYLWGVHYYELDDFRRWRKHKFHPRWVHDADLRKVRSLGFDPRGLPKDVLNIFRGFEATFLPAIPPAEVEGLCACVHDHVLRVLAGGDPEVAAGLTDWFAGFFQHPGRVSGVSPVLVGGRANLFVKWVRLSLIGARYSSSDTSAKKLVRRVFVHVDSRWAVEPALCKRLAKDYRDGPNTPNFLNAIFTTTSELIVQQVGDKAGFPVYRCSNALCGDIGYFSALEARLADPRVQRAYYQSLMSRASGSA
jgi:hypothetical protein